MLQINPFFRISVEDALDHPMFAKIRKPKKELSAESTVTIDFEGLDLDKDKLRQLLLQVVQ